MPDNVDQWITSRSLMQLVRTHRGELASGHHTEAKLLPKLRAGQIRAIAGNAELTLRHRHGRKLETDWSIPSEVWVVDGNTSYFDLSSDKLVRACATGEFNKIDCSYLLFERAPVLSALEIEDRTGEADRYETALEAKDKGGAPVDSEKWANLVALMAAYQLNRDIDTSLKPGTLYSRLADYASEIGATIPSKTTALPAMKLVLEWCKIPHDNHGRPTADKNGKPLQQP